MGAQASAAAAPSETVAKAVLEESLGKMSGEAVAQAASQGDVPEVKRLLSSTPSGSKSGPTRRVLLGALAILLPVGALVAWSGINSSNAVDTLVSNVDNSLWEADLAVRRRLYPDHALHDPAAPAPPSEISPWAEYVERAPSAAAATVIGIPQGPSQLLKRVTKFRERVERGALASTEDEADLSAAVKFWDGYWQEKYSPLLRWLHSPANESPLDFMTAEAAAEKGVSESWAARKAFRENTQAAVDKHFHFYEKLKDAVAGTPLADSLTHFTDRHTELALASLPGPLPAISKYFDPAFPSVSKSGGSAGAVAALKLAREGKVREVKPILAGSLAEPAGSMHSRAFLCGPLAEFCGTEVITDAKAKIIRDIWDRQGYAFFREEGMQVLNTVHSGGPVAIAPETGLIFLTSVDDGEASVFGGSHDYVSLDDVNAPSAEKMVAKAIRDSLAENSSASKVVIPVGTFFTQDLDRHWTNGHASLLVVDRTRNTAQYFDPHGRVTGPRATHAEAIDGRIRMVFQDPEVIEALQGQRLEVDSIRGSANIAKRFSNAYGPQALVGMIAGGHEGSCQLWSLWFAHVLAQFPGMSASEALAAGVDSILVNEDVDPGTRAAVAGAPGSQKLSVSQRVRVGDAMNRFLHKFGTQVMSLMPEGELQALRERVLGVGDVSRSDSLLSLYEEMVRIGAWRDAAPVKVSERARWMKSLLSAIDGDESADALKPFVRDLLPDGESADLAAEARGLQRSVKIVLNKARSDVKPSTFGRPEPSPSDLRSQAADALRLLARLPKTNDPSTFARLWRLRQGFLSPRYVSAASQEAFGSREPPSGKVLQFLQATEFLEDLHGQGVDVSGLGDDGEADPDRAGVGTGAGMAGTSKTGAQGLLQRVARKAADLLWDRGSDSYRGEVATGSFL